MTETIASTGGPRRGSRLARPSVVAALFVLPYLLLLFGWATSNPPGSAPDERDQYIKAIGMGRLDIGARYTGPPRDPGPVGIRNASISRTVQIPAGLVPDGFGCSAFFPNKTAACLPQAIGRSGTVAQTTAFGAYPPFMYVPIGVVARLADSPYHALLLGRLAVLAMSSLLMFVGAWHLIRWLGRRALLGAFVGFTPMVLFSAGSLSGSGVEISSAFAVACVTVSTLRHPESLSLPRTQITLAIVGGVLILSRQLGIVTFGAALILILLRLGWRPFWALIRLHRPAFVASVLILIGCAGAVYYWETTYDNPAVTATPWHRLAIGGFSQGSYPLLQSGIGVFGWLDTLMPPWTYGAWVILIVVLVGIAILIGDAADRWSLIGWMLATVGVAYVTYATVFLPVLSRLQGRHMLPFFMMIPMLAGVVVAERLDGLPGAPLRRLFLLVAVVVPVLQAIAIYYNARRYAVGAQGPLNFLGKSTWRPEIGWLPSLGVGLIGALVLGVFIWWCRPRLDRPERSDEVLERELANVEG